MMAEEDRERRKERRSRRRRNQGKQPGRVVLFLRSYWFEISAVVFLALGVFLLVERVQITAFMFRALKKLANSVANVVNSILAIEKSNIVGIVLILVAIWMMGYSLRRTMLRRAPNLDSAEPCPKCGGHLGRAHSGPLQRLLAAVMRVRIKHYACRDCSFRASVWERRGG
jgi:hypothetical protein